SFVISNLTGSELLTTPSCVLTYDVSYSYPATGQITLTYPGTVPTCQPAGCDATLCSTPKSSRWAHSCAVTGMRSAEWSSGCNSDDRCTSAPPFQDSAVGYHLVLQ